MTTWLSDDIEANDPQLHYTRTGGAKPPLVPAHGVTDDGLCWTPVAEALAPDYTVLVRQICTTRENDGTRMTRIVRIFTD